MKLYRNKYLWTAVFYMWLSILVILTSMSFSDKMIQEQNDGLRWDYLQHFFLYLLIPVFFFFAEGAFLKNLIKQNYKIFLLGLLFASLTELQQLFISSRTYNSIDLALNIGGYIIGIPFGKILANRLKKSKIKF
ncbi:MAG: VanZ family protein [Bacteroidales bacterium]|nr:VanZ family protein [Bacteroidales bacterium]MCF8389361.1 VanZ family protein [Bacteroidales bacterium]